MIGEETKMASLNDYIAMYLKGSKKIKKIVLSIQINLPIFKVIIILEKYTYK